VERIHELLPDADYSSIAAKLYEEGFQTAKVMKYDDRALGYIARTRGWGLGRSKRRKRERA
jgi:hypothetical protein